MERRTGLRSYQVVVGNIGTVYDGHSRELAEDSFKDYRELSRSGYGRAAGEMVTLFEDGDAIRIHDGDSMDR